MFILWRMDEAIVVVPLPGAIDQPLPPDPHRGTAAPDPRKSVEERAEQAQALKLRASTM